MANIGSGPSAADSIIAAFAERGELRIAAFVDSGEGDKHTLRDFDGAGFRYILDFGTFDLRDLGDFGVLISEIWVFLGC